MNSNIKTFFLLLTVSFFAVSSAFAGSTPKAAALYGAGSIASGGVATPAESGTQTPRQRVCATTEDLLDDLYSYYGAADSDETQNDVCALFYESYSFAQNHCPDFSPSSDITSFIIMCRI